MHVCNEFGLWFWCFWWWYGGIFHKMNSEWYWERFKFSFDVEYLECVSSGRINVEMSQLYDLSLLYGGNLLFVDRYWKKTDRMEFHHFWIVRKVLPSRVTGDRRSVNCDAWEWKYCELGGDHLIISATGWL